MIIQNKKIAYEMFKWEQKLHFVLYTDTKIVENGQTPHEMFNKWAQ